VVNNLQYHEYHENSASKLLTWI